MHRNTYRRKHNPDTNKHKTANNMLCRYVITHIIAVVGTNTGIPDTLEIVEFVVLLAETLSSTRLVTIVLIGNKPSL